MGQQQIKVSPDLTLSYDLGSEKKSQLLVSEHPFMVIFSRHSEDDKASQQ